MSFYLIMFSLLFNCPLSNRHHTFLLQKTVYFVYQQHEFFTLSLFFTFLYLNTEVLSFHSNIYRLYAWLITTTITKRWLASVLQINSKIIGFCLKMADVIITHRSLSYDLQLADVIITIQRSLSSFLQMADVTTATQKSLAFVLQMADVSSKRKEVFHNHTFHVCRSLYIYEEYISKAQI